MTLEILIDPSKVQDRAQCNPGGHHSAKLKKLGWKHPSDLQKDQLLSLGKDLGLSLGGASKADTMARAITDRILNPPKKE